MTHAVEKEFATQLKIKRKKDESDQDFFLRLSHEGNALFNKDESNWGKLSEEAQNWFNSATEAIGFDAKDDTKLNKKAGATIPDFDGEIAKEEEAAEEEAAEEEQQEEETTEETADEEAEDEQQEEAKETVSKRKKRTVEAKEEKAPKKVKAKVTGETVSGKEAPAKKKAKAPAKAETKTKTKAKAASGGEKRGRKGSFAETDAVKKVKTPNPFREGSKAAKCWKEYKVGRTVAQILKAGVPRSKLNRHISKGVVTVG
jgi:hypothetical protein